LKLKYDEPLSKFAVKSNMRRYTLGAEGGAGSESPIDVTQSSGQLLVVHPGMGLHSSTSQLNLSHS
jgi:hypothetical protein